MHFEMHGGIRWRCYGKLSNPHVVLLHPIATDGSVWERQAADWEDRFHVIALDLPGHGHSAAIGAGAGIADYAACIASALRAGGVERAAVVGLSIGSMIAQCLAAGEPGLVQSVVLANGAFLTPEDVGEAWEARIAAARAGGMASLRDAMVQRWFTPEFRREDPQRVGAIGALIEATSVEGFVDAADAIARLDNRAALSRIACPALVVAGSLDTAAPPSAVSPIAKAVAGARYVELPAAHLANVEAADIFNCAVGTFLDETMGAAA